MVWLDKCLHWCISRSNPEKIWNACFLKENVDVKWSYVAKTFGGAATNHGDVDRSSKCLKEVGKKVTLALYIQRPCTLKVSGSLL